MQRKPERLSRMFGAILHRPPTPRDERVYRQELYLPSGRPRIGTTSQKTQKRQLRLGLKERHLARERSLNRLKWRNRGCVQRDRRNVREGL
ncbi:hypothetical protein XFF6992_200070 [Xanthomonas citri pv. fuscans]|uniref:Uncharacterized protein n=1 Tax=Xanthomonas campestris pv. phaseoli TaxID=317013 RepID=A0A7Z7IXG2_XANCH|nr:hypothetical protein XFF6990_390187 [Xanthomonas citri pv. fuscans]SOO17944.1 hypothetical protein XFF6992_200070 [Xanthomonas citri pv. fuscans]SOO23417.1 hypothetical protein XFF6991_280076 [Xanthomonas phaseoli pv. phaseoli]SOO30981.1 hypothetical protein XFF6994_1190039 [Xanthomonas citri pv. fuscans]